MGWFKNWFKKDKRAKGFIIGNLERERFNRIANRNDSLNSQIKTTQITWTEIRTKINKDLEIFWNDLFKFYGLRKEKNYNLNQDTGEILEIENLPKVIPVKEEKKNG